MRPLICGLAFSLMAAPALAEEKKPNLIETVAAAGGIIGSAAGAAGGPLGSAAAGLAGKKVGKEAGELVSKVAGQDEPKGPPAPDLPPLDPLADNRLAPVPPAPTLGAPTEVALAAVGEAAPAAATEPVMEITEPIPF